MQELMTNNLAFSHNMLILRKKKRLTQAELSDKLDVKRTTIGGYESGTSTPDVATLIRIAGFFGVTIDELLFADLKTIYEQSEAISSIQHDLAPTVKAIAEANKSVVNANLNANLSANPSVKSTPKNTPISTPNAILKPEMGMVREEDIPVYGSKSRAIPILDARAAAGWPYTIDGTGFLDQRPTLSLPFGWFQSGEYVLIQIEGDSMHPTIYNGDWAFVRKIDKISEIKDGYVHVVLTREGIVCKRVLNRSVKGHLALQSDNSAYPTYTVPLDEILSIWKVEMKMSAILRNENLDIIKRLSGVEADIAELKLKKK